MNYSRQRLYYRSVDMNCWHDLGDVHVLVMLDNLLAFLFLKGSRRGIDLLHFEHIFLLLVWKNSSSRTNSGRRLDGFGAACSFFMLVQIRLKSKWFTAFAARERLYCGMGLLVGSEIRLICKRFTANCALEWLLTWKFNRKLDESNVLRRWCISMISL